MVLQGATQASTTTWKSADDGKLNLFYSLISYYYQNILILKSIYINNPCIFETAIKEEDTEVVANSRNLHYLLKLNLNFEN